MYRIEKAAFLDKMKNSELQLLKIKQKCAHDHKKMMNEIRKMKQSNVSMDYSLKKSIDDSQFVAREPDVLQRNANLMRFFEKDMKKQGLINERKYDRTKEQRTI